ncbi:MAG: cytochrome c biogenesis protein CcsA [Phycisphaeraceae bacterium]|nr:cytochrome c biogenesis protein CcsA [Phycisphaerales bacterium]MCB9859919.1 cytochrome c biogenesis protein CcsA [Phycisphaeraceae bacterium]
MTSAHSAPSSFLQRAFPWIVCMLLVLFLGSSIFRGAPKSDSGFDYDAFGRIPVSAEGRTKPLDTVARNALMQISGKQSVELSMPASHHDNADVEAGRKERKVEAIEWLAWVMTRSQEAADFPVFRIDHPDVLGTIGLAGTDRKRFSLNELLPNVAEIDEQASRALNVPAKQRDPFQRHIANLDDQLTTYALITRSDTPYFVPPLTQEEDWQSASSAAQNAPSHPGFVSIEQIMLRHQSDDVEAFNEAVKNHLNLVAKTNGRATSRANVEVIFNRAKPFLNAAVLYVLAFLLALFSVLFSCMQTKQGWADALGRAALGVIFISFVMHTIGLGTRIYLQGRPPVTNLYSSAIFVGWGCVLLGMFLERLFRIGIGSIVASAVGFATLIIAHNLSSGGDTMQMMQAVLDSNFWLATHVVVITIGYSATFLAGALAIVYILMGVLTLALNKERATALSKMIYGVICFASLMSFVGTVLGGIWADQSWGRFWGWDPKENGAVLIVMMNLLILHARWGGMIKQRGMAVLAVFGNIITAWAWFGTNMLGVGLHSYGFTNSAAFWLIVFVASQLLIMTVGTLPQRLWMSDPKQPGSQSMPSLKQAVSI